MKEPIKLDWRGSVVLDAIGQIIEKASFPEIQTEIAKRCSESIGRHLIHLIITASDAMLSNRYSVALALFRNMEDALDCYAAVSLIQDAADRWANGKLKASEAAKLWENRLGDVYLPTGEKAVDYRKTLRNYFNNFAHCSPYLTDWNIYPELDSTSEEKIAHQPNQGHTLSVEFRVNHNGKFLSQNAFRISGYLAAHTLEFASVTKMAYDSFLIHDSELGQYFENSVVELENIIKERFGAIYLDDRPPEIQKLVIRHPLDADKIMLFPLRVDKD